MLYLSIAYFTEIEDQLELIDSQTINDIEAKYKDTEATLNEIVNFIKADEEYSNLKVNPDELKTEIEAFWERCKNNPGLQTLIIADGKYTTYDYQEKYTGFIELHLNHEYRSTKPKTPPPDTSEQLSLF